MTHQGKRNRSGLTVVELLVVIAIIAILINLLLPVVQKVRERAATNNTVQSINEIGNAAQRFHATIGTHRTCRTVLAQLANFARTLYRNGQKNDP
jgi:prepilin-type N-terminal cleavage/methylation domain-containing protein